MNLFRCTPDRSLDRLYLRTCAIYRLLKSYRINKEQALALQSRRFAAPEGHTGRLSPPKEYLTATIEIWLAGPLSERGRAAQIKFREQGQ